VRSNIIVGSAAPRLPLPPLAITLNEPNDIFTVDKIIPVEVVSAIHSPMQGEISAIARPLACRRKETVWTVAEPARAGAGVDPEKLSELGKRLEEVLEARAALVESSDETEQGLARNLLLSCLNTYKTPAPLPAGFEPQEVAGAEGLKKLQSLLTPGTRWTRPLEKEYDWAGVCQVSLPPDAPLPPNYEAATAPAEAVLAMFQNAILGAVGVVNDMTRVFYTKEILTSHKAIFLLMRMKQLSPPQPPGGKA
jgi:hypothetical protein